MRRRGSGAHRAPTPLIDISQNYWGFSIHLRLLARVRAGSAHAAVRFAAGAVEVASCSGRRRAAALL